MTRLLSTLVTIVWALWFGGMVMLLVAVITLFDTFGQDRESFSRAAGTLFRVFERGQLALAAVALLGTFGWRLAGSARLKTALFALFAVATLASVASTAVITPKVESLRQERLTTTPEFRRMHGLSSAVYMTGAVALLLAGVVLPSAIRSDAHLSRRRESGGVGGTGNGNGHPEATDPPLVATHSGARD